MRWYDEPQAHEGLIYATFGFTPQQKSLDGEADIKINKGRGWDLYPTLQTDARW